MLHKVVVHPFARERHLRGPASGKSYFTGSEENLLLVIESALKDHEPRHGYKAGVVLLEVDPALFCSGLVRVQDKDPLVATFEARRQDEDRFVTVRAKSLPREAGFVEVVLYRHDVLAADNDASCEDPDSWEVISINAWPGDRPGPMDPIAMARNQLGLAGGTKAEFSAEDFARSIVFWAQHVMCAPMEEEEG